MTDITAIRISNYVRNLLEFSSFDNVHELNAELVTHIATNPQPDERYLVDSLLNTTTASSLAVGLSALSRGIAYIEAQIDSIGDMFDEGNLDVVYLPMTDSTFMFSVLSRRDFDTTFEDVKGRFGWVAINSVRDIPDVVKSLTDAMGIKAVGETERLYTAAMDNKTNWYSPPELEGGIDADLLASGYQAAVDAVEQYRGFLQHNPDYRITFMRAGDRIHAILRRKVA